MIVFDLACRDAGHVFEIWFGSSEDYESQKARGLVSCPYCGSADIDKAVMAPNVGAKGNQRAAASPALPVPAGANVPAATGMPSPEQFKALVSKLAEMQAKALEGSDYVGDKFADEARSIHYGEQDARAIHGQTSLSEAKALVEEGVPLTPLIMPVRAPKSEN